MCVCVHLPLFPYKRQSCRVIYWKWWRKCCFFCIHSLYADSILLVLLMLIHSLLDDDCLLLQPTNQLNKMHIDLVCSFPSLHFDSSHPLSIFLFRPLMNTHSHSRSHSFALSLVAWTRFSFLLHVTESRAKLNTQITRK